MSTSHPRQEAGHATAAEEDAVGYSAGRETTEGTVYTVTGGDWDEIAEAAAKSDDERIIVNMGPQHPSTHGVLRLILEIDGETVTEARCGIGYLHTGIEKNLEYRTWTQGTTFVTRMDYLTPFYNEAAYCLGVEKLLGIEDQVPDRASVIRVLLMELNRLSSHLVAIATGGMELGATTIMIYGFRDREVVLDPLRADHRPAHEPRVHPPRRPRPGPPGRRPRPGPRGGEDPPQEHRRVRQTRHREPAVPGPHEGHRVPGPGRLHVARHHRAGAPLDRPAARPAQDRPVLRLRDVRLRGADRRHLRLLRAVPHPARRDARVAEDRRAVSRPAPRARRGHGLRQEDRLAGAARPSARTASATPSTTSRRSWAPRWSP